MLKIELENTGAAFRPGSTMRGTIHWQLAKIPSEISASLSWYTEGKGDEDGDLVVEQSWEPTSDQGSQKFSWVLPRGPISYNGNLIRIRWLLEIASTKPDESIEREIVISRLDRPIVSGTI